MPRLHIPGPTVRQQTICDRQLNNHRGLKAQDAVNVKIAASLEQYMTALREGKACLHCGRAAGILPPLKRPVREIPDSEEGDAE